MAIHNFFIILVTALFAESALGAADENSVWLHNHEPNLTGYTTGC